MVLGPSVSSGIVWMAMPLAPGSLSDAIQVAHSFTGKGLRDEDLAPAAAQACAGIKALHDINFLHLDIKPSNMLWHPSTKTLQIVDFSLAQRIKDRVVDELLLEYSLYNIVI